jgi:hypothetical protein
MHGRHIYTFLRGPDKKQIDDLLHGGFARTDEEKSGAPLLKE